MRRINLFENENPEALKRQAEITKKKYIEENLYAEELSYFLNKIKYHCTICIAKGNLNESLHRTIMCRDLNNLCYNCCENNHYRENCRVILNFGSDICPYCHLPNELGGVTFHYGSWGDNCHQMQIKGFALGMFLYQRESLGIGEMRKSEYMQWLCQKKTGKVNNVIVCDQNRKNGEWTIVD